MTVEKTAQQRGVLMGAIRPNIELTADADLGEK